MEIRRPLRRAVPKLGPPDIYPQDPKQKEDELTSVNVKQGYTSAPLISGPNQLDEFGTAKNANIEAFGVYFSALLSEKHRINTIKDAQKKKQLVNTKEIWYVHAKTKHAVDNWFRDLANGNKSLGQLGKRIPIFNSKEGMFAQLYESHVPLTKAVWFIKMSAVHAIAMSESSSKSKKRQVPDQCQELTAALIKYFKDLSLKMPENSIPITSSEDFIPTYNQWQYQTLLARFLFDEGLLDQYDFLCFLLELIEKKRPINEFFVKIICPLILEYVINFSRSAVLSRRLAHVCAKRLSHTINHYPLSSWSTKKNDTAQIQQQHGVSSISNQNNGPSIDKPTGSNTSVTNRFSQIENRISDIASPPSLRISSAANRHTSSNSLLEIVKIQLIESQNNFIESVAFFDQENNESNLYRSATAMLSSIIQVLCLECPTALVRHHIVDAKFPSMFHGSPLDHLPCLPSKLPMMESHLNLELRKSIHDAEREILYRSAMADFKWSCDSASKFESSRGGMVNRLLTVMDLLDKHNFDKIDLINSVDILYQKIFPPLDTIENNNKAPMSQVVQPAESINSTSSGSGVLDLSSQPSSHNQLFGTAEHSKKSKHQHQLSSAHTSGNQHNHGHDLTSQNSYEDQVILLLCEWATTTQRTGEHRALVVARLLEKRQTDIQNALSEISKNCNSNKSMKSDESKSQPTSNNNRCDGKQSSSTAASNPNQNEQSASEQNEEVVQFSFQNLLVQFLDVSAPVIDENLEDNPDNKKAFNNLVLLFSELIRCDVFSHYNYMCTLISRGMFNDLAKGTHNNPDSSSIDSPAPNSNLNPPGSIKQPKSVGKESDSILAGTIQGFGNSNIYPLSVSTSAGGQSNQLDPLSKLSSNADQSLRSLGFSPVSSQQNTSQSIDKGHSLMDNHIDDVDADLGKILQDIREGQQDEADVLLPDFLGGSSGLKEDKGQQISKLSPFGLSDRTSGVDNSMTNASTVMSSGTFPPTSADTKPKIPSNDERPAKSPNEHRHMIFVKHFPVPDDENFAQDMNQRNILLYGFGKEREDARHALKKLNKEICKLFGRRASRDINDGGRIKKMASRDMFNPDTTLQKFETLSQHDQHIITNSLSMTVLEMYTGVSNGQASFVPTLESLSFVFELFTMASNASGLLELVIPILEELPDVESQIRLKCPPLTNQYTHSIALCIIGILYRYQSCLLLSSKDELCSIFDSLLKLVSQPSPNPGLCATSAERVIFRYIYDLYSVQTGRIFDQYSNLVQRIKQSLQAPPSLPYTHTEHDWTATVLPSIINRIELPAYSSSSTNPILNAGFGPPSMNSFNQVNANDITSTIRQHYYLFDSPTIRQINDSPSARYRFVCDAIWLSATAKQPDLVNDIAVLCADVSSKCPVILNDWLSALQALCCSAQRDLNYRPVVNKINISDSQVMDNIAIFVAVLVSRRSLTLDDFIIKCAMAGILGPLGSNDRQSTEPGVRLACHILLSLFRSIESATGQSRYNQPLPQNPTQNAFSSTFHNFTNNASSYNSSILGSMPQIGLLQANNKEQDKPNLYLKYLCDHHLLRSACCATKTECLITLLKAIRLLAMLCSPNNDLENQGKVKIENHFEDLSMDGIGNTSRDLDGRNSPGIFNTDSNLNFKFINLQTASLHQFADTILRLLCSQRWLHDKCLNDSEVFTTTDPERNILLDPRFDVKQSQRLLYMICYNKSPERQADVGLDDQGSDQVVSIVKMFENLDVWSMRLSLMRLQFMFAYCKSQSNVTLNDWLDNLAKAVVDFFQKASQEENQEKDSDESLNESDKKSKGTKNQGQNNNNTITNINRVWLIEPLLDKLTRPPSAVQSKIIKASAALMESASVRANSLPSLNQTYLSTAAASTKFKERTLSQRGSASTNPSNLASTSLLGFQPFLSLLLSCIKNQDKERETLLTSLNSQLYQAIHEKVDDIGYKQSLQDGLELRLCLIGQMFDTIQKSPNLTSDWATLLLLLIINGLVDPQVDYGLYVSVLDMLAMLIHSAYASDPIEQREESRKQYQNLMKKFRKELTALEEKGFLQMKLINPLMPLVRQMTEVITCEPMGSLVDTKGEKVENFYSIDKKKGLKVSELQEVSPWDLIEGHKNPAPLSWPWFGAIRLEQKPLRADENNRLMSWHTHTIRQRTSYFCQAPNIDEVGPPSAKRSNFEKKPSQSNPLLKSLIEASDESSMLSRKDTNTSTLSTDDDSMNIDPIDDLYISREDYYNDRCDSSMDMLLDSTPIETMIEDIKSAIQAEHAAMTSRPKPQLVETKPILSSSQASSILAPIQPDSKRSAAPQVSALSALQNHLNVSGSSESSSILVSSGPASVPPPQMSMSPIVNPRTPELSGLPARPASNLPKIVSTPPPAPINVAGGRSMSPMIASRSPMIQTTSTLATPTSSVTSVGTTPLPVTASAIVRTPPVTKPKAPRKRRTTKKDTNANALIDANSNIQTTNVGKNTAVNSTLNASNHPNMMSTPTSNYPHGMDSMNHTGSIIVNQAKHGPQANQLPIHQMQQQQQQHPQQVTRQPSQGMMGIRRGVMTPQHQQQSQRQQQLQQQSSVYDFPYQPSQPQPNNQFVTNASMNTYYDQQAQPNNNVFGGQMQQPQQQQQQMQMGMQTAQHQHQQTQHQMSNSQHLQQQQQQQHHQIQYQQTAQNQNQHSQQQHGGQQILQPQQIRLPGHQQQSMQFQAMQQHQHQQQQIFAPQQAAGHSRPALTAMLHQKHAAAGNMDNKMHPQPRFNFG